MQHVAAADGVAGHHGHDRLGRAADLDLEVEHVEAADALLGHLVVADVAVVAADALVAAGAEGLGRPAPVRMMTPTVSSSRASLKASASSNSVWGRKALRTSGRLMVILAMPSAVLVGDVAVVARTDASRRARSRSP